jgi:hypothetical protein
MDHLKTIGLLILLATFLFLVVTTILRNKWPWEK